MRVFTELIPRNDARERGVAIGTFDGVHVGHQELLKQLVQVCRRDRLVPTVFTFSSHPEMVFGAPGQFPGYLMDEQDRLAAFEAFGIEEVFLLPLVPDVYDLSAQMFLDQWMRKQLNARLIVVGKDARFGAGNTGDIVFLRDWCSHNKVKTLVVGDVFLEGDKVSSTRIRRALTDKQVEFANRMLVHPCRLNGKVEKGRNLGSRHGIPTANFSMPPMRLTMPYGVYVSRVKVDGRWHDAISNIGLAPTVKHDSTTARVESHLFDYSADMYDKEIRVEILKFLRDEIEYDSFAAMLPQIERDKQEARRFLDKTELPVVRLERNGIPLVALHTTRFQIGHAALVFRLRAVKKRMPALAILLNMMTRRTKLHTTPASLEQYLSSLGDADFAPVIAQEGDIQVLGLHISAPESAFGLRHLKEAISLLIEAVSEVFFDADTGDFDEWFQREQKQLIDMRLAEEDDKMERAIRLTLEAVLNGQPHGYHMVGDIADIEAVSKDDLREAYKNLLHDAHAAFYVSGDISHSLLSHIDVLLKSLPDKCRPRLIDTWPTDPVLETMSPQIVHTDTTQHIVISAIQNGASWYQADRWADYLFADMLGGGQHSLLFRHLRDRAGLCYQIYMIPYTVIGISLLVAATTTEDAEAVKTGFKRELERLTNNEFTDDLLSASRRYLDHAVTRSWDQSQARLLSMINWHVYGHSGQLIDKRAFLHNVGRDDVVRMANAAKPLLVFELAGLT